MDENWTIEQPPKVVDPGGWQIERPLVTSLSVDKPTYLSMPKDEDAEGTGLFDTIKNIFPESPFAEKASAQNAIQISRETGITPSLIDKKMMQQYAEKQGAYTQPESKEFITKLMVAPIAAGLMTHPLATVIGLTAFGGLAEAENYAVSKFKDEKYKFGAGKGLADLTAEGTSEAVKDVFWLTDMTWQALAAGGAVKGGKAGVDKFAEKFMRDIVTEYNMPRSVFISPEKIREFHGMGREDVISPEETTMLKDINLSRQDYVNAVRDGIDIELPVEKLVTIQDKPWVKSLKEFFKTTPYEVTKTEAGGLTAKRPISGMLESEPERDVASILKDIGYLLKKNIGNERGEVALKDLSPEDKAIWDRLGKDFEVIKTKAEQAGKDVAQYMKENGFDEKVITYMSTAFNKDAEIVQPEAALQYKGYREIGKNEVLEPGADVKMDMATGKNYVKESSQPGATSGGKQAWEGLVYRGKGEKPADAGDLGIGEYSTTSEASAKQYGEVSQGKVVLQNPLRLTADEAGKLASDYGTLQGSAEAKKAASTKLTNDLQVKGHDGIVVDRYDTAGTTVVKFPSSRPPEVGGQSALAAETAQKETPDDINALLSMAAKQDVATGKAEIGDNPSYDAIRQKAAQLAFEKINKKIDFQKRKEVAALKRQGEVDARQLPVFTAMEDIIKAGGIKKSSLEADYDKDTIKELMRKRPGLVTENGKYGLDEFAQEHNFDSDETLLSAMLDWKGIKAEGKVTADDFIQNYADLISKAEANDFHIELLQEEEKILAKLLKQNAPKSATGLKGVIRQETGQVRVEELMVSEYDALTAAMKKAEQASRKAFSEGKLDGALTQKTKQREIAERLKARLEAKQEAKDIHDGILKIMKDKNMPEEYKDRIEDFLSDYDLYPRSNKGRARVESTREFLDRMEIQGEDVNIPQSLLNKIERYGRIHWRELSLEQLRDIYDQTKMLAHLGKMKNKLVAAKEARDYDNVVSGIITNIKKNWPGVNAAPTDAEIETMLMEPTWREKTGQQISGYNAELTKPEYIFRRLDKWQELGPAWDSFYKPIQDAYNAEATALGPIIEKLQIMFKPFTEKHGGKWAKEKYKIEGVPQILTKEKMILVALNTGNEGNLTALREGYNWTDEQINAITGKLTAPEWRLVQDVWSLYKSMFPKLADVYNKLSGAELVAVEGNYHPLVFDRTLSWIADKNAAETDLKDFFQTIYTKPKVTTGAVIERKGGKLPPKLSFDVIFKHVADVNHYTSHALSVRDVQKLLSDPKIRSAIETAPDGIGGKDAYAQLMPWLQNVAKPKVDPLSITESILKTIRRNATTVALGLKFSVAAFQWLGTTQSIEALGHNNFVKGFLDFYTHRGDMVDAIKEKSPEMANRAQSWDRELNDAYGRLGIENFKGSQMIKDAYFSLITLMDMSVAYPTWQAGYDKGMKEFNGDESKAVYFADMKVRNSQGNALPKDFANIQRGSELKKFVTMFYTFFSSMQNQIAEVQTRFKYGEKNIFELMKSWWWIVIAPALLSYLMMERKIPSAKEAVKQIIQYRFGGYPVLRDIVSPVFSDYDYQFSPAARFGEVAGKALLEGIRLPTDEGDSEKFLRNAFESTGYMTGIPTGQALVTIKGFNDLKNGETSDLTRLLLRGPHENEED
jgi:hypothetical protein